MTFARVLSDKANTQRNLILTDQLRPGPLPFGITEEYPIVLDAKNNAFSYGIFQNDDLVCHANLWPRTVIDPKGISISNVGLIGNVATSGSKQGQGYMKSLFSNLEQIAIEKNFSALFLWSDLPDFYQKLGFNQVGFEMRYFLRGQIKKHTGKIALAWQKVSHNKLSMQDFQNLLELRPKSFYTLERSLEEFTQLLTIPALDIFILRNHENGISGYVLMGKGADMVGVAHEWGGTAEAIVDACQYIRAFYKIDEIVLLSPNNLDQDYSDVFGLNSHKTELHPLGHAKILDDSIKGILPSLFVWGLDSI